MRRQNKYISVLIVIYFATVLFSKSIYGQYEGGEGPGSSYGEENSACAPVSIFTGTAGDGYDFVASLQVCQSNLFTIGGNGNGFTIDTNLHLCLPTNIYTGNTGDGFGLEYSSLCPDDSILIQAEVLVQASCTSPGLGSAIVSIVNGFPVWQSLADFTYIWKDINGDTLSGYPLVKSSLNDTVLNLAIGEYTVIVYDANLKVDSTIIYINDCLYRGGDGSGYKSDSAIQLCSTESIYTNSSGDGFAFSIDNYYCDFFLFSKGGNGAGFSIDTNTQNCLSPAIYKGETGDGYAVFDDLLICDSRLFSVGGTGSGYSSDTSLQNCEALNTFRGTPGDGFDYTSDISYCFSTLSSSGGTGSGFAIDTNIQNCLPGSIYTNSGSDGFDYAADILNCESVLFTQGGDGNGFSAEKALQDCFLPNIFTGNTSAGFSTIYEIPCLKDSIVIQADVLSQITCPISTNNGSAHVSIVEGFPDWRSIPDFTYTWKNSVGVIMPGYPKTIAATADTIINLGVDDYTVIVSDAFGNTDSAIVYITDCLYRGGEGLGFSEDSALSQCLLESIYTNSGDDGFDYAFDKPLCNSGLYSSGGFGNGFSIDTNLQDCNILSVYTNSGGDGFDYVEDILNCQMTYFSSGGDGDGFSIDTLNQICNLPNINTGDQGDGSDQQYNGCTPYIYDVPGTNNTCLNADTIASIGSNQWQQITLNGQLVAAIKDNGNNLGSITTQFYVNNTAVRIDPFAILPSYYLDRNYKISAQNLIFGSPVRLRLYFTANEYQALINADINVTSQTSLGITPYHGPNENCSLTDNVDNNDNFNYLHYTNYDWDTYENGYYLEFDINSFAEFYINNSTSLPLPYVITADLIVSSDYNGSDISCYGASDGKATITPTYGIAPFTYQWDDSLLQTDSIATGLAAGMYHVTIIDNNNVTYSDSIEITQADTISIAYVSTDACAGKNNGTIDLTVSGGTLVTDYTYSWSTSNGFGIVAGAEDQTSLSGGEYVVTVEDANTCTKVDSITIIENTVSTNATGVSIANNSTCLGTIKTLTPIGGVLGYNASWNWYSEAACTNLLHTGNSYDIDPVNTTSYWLRAEGDCDSTATVSETVVVLTTSTVADSISKTVDNIAPGTNDTLAILGGSLGTGASWAWYQDAAGTIPVVETPSGTNSDSLIVAPINTTQYWARAEGTCNNTTMVSTTISINPLPLKAATPMGVDTLCQNAANESYTTTGANGATSYIWTIAPAAAGTISGSGTTGTVDWSSGYYGTVVITVTGENVSGTGPISDDLKIWVWKIPGTGPTYHIDNIWGQ